MRFTRFHTGALTGSLASGLACLAFSPLASAQNLLTDPGMELQTSVMNPNPTGLPGWANFGGTQFSQTYAHTGLWSLWTPDNGGGYNVPGTYQDFAASPGETFTLSGWVYTPNTLVAGSNDFAILQMSFFNGSPPNNYASGTQEGPTVGVNIGDPIGGGGLPLLPGVWTFATVSATAPAGTNSMGAYMLDINADANADFYFDDMSLTATPVPEPVSASVLLIAGIPCLMRRRRAK